MKFKIIRSKFLEGLASLQNIVAERGEMPILVEALESNVISSSEAFREGLIRECNKDKKLDCPVCGGSISKDLFGEDTDICGSCHQRIPREYFTCKTYRVCEQGVADFVGKKIGEFGHAQKMGDGNYRLGKAFGKSAFFCASPKEGFFNAHAKDTIIGACDVSTVPRGWADNGCVAIEFSELFYSDSGLGKIRIADSALSRLKPAERKRRFSNKNRRIHERRNLCLTVLMNMFAEPFRASDFRNGKITPAAAKRLIRKVDPKFDLSDKTITRDIAQFSTFDAKKEAYDKREPLIAQLLKYAADPTVPQTKRTETANAIKNLLLKAKADAERNGGIPVELPETGWVVGADGKSERVCATTEDRMLDEIDARNEAAA